MLKTKAEVCNGGTARSPTVSDLATIAPFDVDTNNLRFPQDGYRDLPMILPVPSPSEDPPTVPMRDEFVGEERGLVKFYDPNKGFGFVTSSDDGQEVFLPGRILETFGAQTVAPGATIVFEAEDQPDDRKPKIWRIVSIDERTATDPAVLKHLRPAGGEVLSDAGTVTKWVSGKGFGFVTTDGGDNVFVHLSVSRIGEPKVGTRCKVTYAEGEKSFVATGIHALTKEQTP